ncbi:MAG: asparagine synthase (glutamine-hydrolyzing) [Pirellulales bacterium]|nr:asparagine synthase (glutamine-hydrolyzing) [Pirellulales bacterium]
MCGIASILLRSSESPQLDVALRKMTDVQEHRGPDAQGQKIFSNGDFHVGLGHRRLSIIDLTGGVQPMANEDHSIWVTYNGEIYNHLELRKELINRGHQYQTHSDTETIVHAYEEWGPDCVNRFRGMFAFVIWDSGRQRLFAARDKLGIKPLYYALGGNQLLCASEIKSIFASGLCSPQLNDTRLPELLTFGYLSGQETLFEGVQTLPPGHRMFWSTEGLAVEQYWDIPQIPDEPSVRSEADWISQFTELFEETVSLRLMSDVPLGVFLSGGLDSSAIAATMAGQMGDPLKTFSVGFDSQYYSEFSFAREVAASIGADHHEVVLHAENLISSIPKLVWHEDKPIRNPSSVALYHVAELAREHVKVVLTGEGSDELFAGYHRYWATLFNLRWGNYYEQLTPRWVREKLIRSVLWKWPLPLSIKKKLSHTFFNHSMRPEEIVFDNFHSIFPGRIHEALFSPDFYNRVKDANPYQDAVAIYASRPGKDALDKLLYVDQKTYLVELLMKQDRMSMAASIESRVPFLDHEMVEFATRVPSNLKLNGRRVKYLVKQAMQKLVPHSILAREKMGFPVPLRQWLHESHGSLFASVLSSDRVKQRNIFNDHFLNTLLMENDTGQRDHTDALWTLMNFEIWARIFLDGDDPHEVSSEIMSSCKTDGLSRGGGISSV